MKGVFLLPRPMAWQSARASQKTADAQQHPGRIDKLWKKTLVHGKRSSAASAAAKYPLAATHVCEI